ncbi:cytoglobin-1-like isoform X2 [Diabrotica undecimpunctata]
MGSVLSYFLGFFVNQGRIDDANPVTGLTSRDVYLITNTWNKVISKPTENGINFFMRLFEIEPKHKLAFPFKDLPTESLPSNKRFHAHVNGVMYSISSIVSSLNDADTLVAIIDKIGRNHVRRSVDLQALKDVKRALLDIFAFMTTEELAAWSKMLDYFAKTAIKAMDDEN